MKIRFGLVLMLALGLGSAGCASGGSGGGTTAAPTRTAPGAEVLRQGERPRQTENTRAAQRHLDAAEDADDPAEAKMHYEQALAAAEAGIAEDATNPLPYRQAALAALGLEDYQKAGEYFDKAAELRPIYEFEDAGLRERAWIDLYQKAIPLVEAGDYEAAAKVFEDANAIYDARPEAMVTLAQIYAQLREYDKALEMADRALEIINSDRALEMDSATVASWQEQVAELPMLKAMVLAEAGRLEEAAEAFRAIVAEHPDDLLARRNLAGVLLQAGQTEEAFRVYEELLQQPDLTAADYYTVAVGFYNGSAYDRAAEAFKKSAELNVKDRDALEMWTRSLQLDSAYAAIPEAAERWIELDPYSQSAHLIYAQATNQLGDEDKTRELVQKIEAMPIDVRDLQITRYSSGGARVTGSVVNKKLDEGTTITLVFTFYTPEGEPMGTVETDVTLSGPDMASVFSVDFDSTEQVGGYGYTVRGL